MIANFCWKKAHFVFILGLALSSLATTARGDDDKLNVGFGAFVDTYYNYDFNTPPSSNRTLVTGALFGTQVTRSNEFNVNLAYLEAKISSDRVRGRFALQTGTSVQANYASEINGLGTNSTSVNLAELIQEAWAGYRICDHFWVDAGIFFSHIGLETWISRDNLLYTRSLLAEYSPYYEAGVKFTYEISKLWTAQFLILNGWQNIYNVDQSKAPALVVTYSPSDDFTLTYDNIVFNEPGNLVRFYNDVYAKYIATPALQLQAEVSAGSQVLAGNSGTAYWYGWQADAKYAFTPRFSLGARVEGFFDRNGIVVPTGTPNGFMTYAGGLDADFQLAKNLVWRNQFQIYSSLDSVFSSSNGSTSSDKYIVTSFGLSI